MLRRTTVITVAVLILAVVNISNAFVIRQNTCRSSREVGTQWFASVMEEAPTAVTDTTIRANIRYVLNLSLILFIIH
jgi:hypothetical protein